MIHNVVDELIARGITSIKRVWKVRNYEAALKEREVIEIKRGERLLGTFTGYIFSDYQWNLQKALSLLENSYNAFFSALFSHQSSIIGIRGEYNVAVPSELGDAYISYRIKSNTFSIKMKDYKELSAIVVACQKGKHATGSCLRTTIAESFEKDGVILYYQLKYLLAKILFENGFLCNAYIKTGFDDPIELI